MRSRRKTLGQNLAIFAGIFLVVAGNGYYWGKKVKTKEADLADLKKRIKSLESDRQRQESELRNAEGKVAQYSAQIAERRKELRGYGEFLPPISTRPDVQKFIYQTIEDLNISIKKTDDLKLTNRPHYSKLDIRLSLRGSYRDFKLLLARIYKSERFIRITEFKVLTLEDESHQQSVNMAFQTYFSNSRRG